MFRPQKNRLTGTHAYEPMDYKRDDMLMHPRNELLGMFANTGRNVHRGIELDMRGRYPLAYPSSYIETRQSELLHDFSNKQNRSGGTGWR